MSQTTQRSIWLVTAPGEKAKAFGTQDLALEYKNNFSKGGKVEETTLFEKIQEESSDYRSDPDDPDDYSPRKKSRNIGPYDMDY